MKKLRKIGKIAIPAVGVVAAGAGAVQTYGDYNKTDGTLMLQNIEAMTAIYEPCTKAKNPSGVMEKVKYFYGECVLKASERPLSQFFVECDENAFHKLRQCDNASSYDAVSALPYACDPKYYWKTPSGVGECSKEDVLYRVDKGQRFGVCYVKAYNF